MNIGLIIYGRLETISGGFLYDRQLVAHLRQAGHHVHLISLPWTHYARHLSYNLSRSLWHRLGNGRYDLLLQDELTHPSLFWLNQRLRRRYRLVSIVHHLRSSEARPAWQNGLYRQIERRYLNSVDGFVYNSQTTRQAVETLLPKQRPFVVAYPGGNRFGQTITPAIIQSRALADGPLRLLFVGNVIPRKGLHTLLAALALLPASRWRLTVVGETAVDPAYTCTLQQQIHAARLASNVTWLGPLSDAELAQQFALHQLFVLPSSYEGFGIVYLEAMSFGLPVIATTAGAAHELVVSGENGWLIAPSAATDLAQHIAQLHQQRSLLAHMGQAAYQRSQNHPTWADSMEKVVYFCKQLWRHKGVIESKESS